MDPDVRSFSISCFFEKTRGAAWGLDGAVKSTSPSASASETDMLTSPSTSSSSPSASSSVTISAGSVLDFRFNPDVGPCGRSLPDDPVAAAAAAAFVAALFNRLLPEGLGDPVALPGVTLPGVALPDLSFFFPSSFVRGHSSSLSVISLLPPTHSSNRLLNST